MVKKLLLLIFITSFSISFSQVESYYDDVNLALIGIDLKNELATKIIATHTNMLTYTPGVWEASKITDANPSNSSEVVLIYGWEDGSDGDITNDSTRDNSLQDSGGGASFVWNREHVFSKSLADPILITTNPGPGTDAHHLRPADKTRNSTRSNYKFASGSGNSNRSSVTYNGPEGANTRGWYPGDEWKGDVARMMMYMYVRYGDQCLPTAVGVGNSTSTPDDMIDLFLQWNVEDPVSEFEKGRNTFHENTSNTYAQGNRNPFIDNPYLATVIWGGAEAEDTWGTYTTNDNEAPTVPTSVSLSNITTYSIDASWTAATDNIGVTSYDIFVDGNLKGNSTSTNYTITGLSSSTTYAVTVLAKDISNNKSNQTTAVNGTTLVDNDAPTTPTNLIVTNEIGNSFRVSWTESTDNTAVTSYDVYLDGTFNTNTINTATTITNLNISTTYSVTVLAKDSANNESAQSTPVDATTTDGTNNANELFFSEYVEGTFNGNNAIEIVNLTGNTIDMANYSIKKQTNGAGGWISELPLSGTININDVFVIINSQAEDDSLNSQADLSSGAPINFNGNDPIGLFKNGSLIDIIGVFNSGGGNFAENVTLRRKLSVLEPNIGSDKNLPEWNLNEWETFSEDTFNGIGVFDGVLNIENEIFNSFKMYPNPANGNSVYFNVTEDVTINIYNVLGKLISISEVTKNKNNIDISQLAKGIYLVKINSRKQFITKKLIKN
ncbi:endonuclease [Polaribacter sp. SA4-12]|uniref:endonuclease n=1 Tax=Polaribacter sp. SA4-12 TaxID=1312072 RepID=UPI000B3C3399|nr:endonuclease [Polaribacter sp. SA4-12]ARV14525.1 hypothetical protein BTO07_04880 [Polaribacter sp. SA4-12]